MSKDAPKQGDDPKENNPKDKKDQNGGVKHGEQVSQDALGELKSLFEGQGDL